MTDGKASAPQDTAAKEEDEFNEPDGPPPLPPLKGKRHPTVPNQHPERHLARYPL